MVGSWGRWQGCQALAPCLEDKQAFDLESVQAIITYATWNALNLFPETNSATQI